ncbi:MAG: thiamine pyrophosphate-binding protein [Minwuiales bacterium]|nr:thiamine pyrophosphate-binding protein [Minwuiales bacterium]
MTQWSSVGEAVVAALEAWGVDTGFGVISIHNMPILDAIGRRNRIRFVPARGEAGAVNMADAFARVSGRLGLAVTSTGTGAGNAAGALVEAETAGTPLLHLTGQVESAYVDRGMGFIHEAKDQAGMLRAISKAFFRIDRPEAAIPILRKAVATALSAPTGPVSIEIPIDIQRAPVEAVVGPPPQPDAVPRASDEEIDALAARLLAAKRPLLWVGFGCLDAREAVVRLADMGIAVVTSAHGRAILAEDHPGSLGVFNQSPASEAFYATCDAFLVAGSRLRGNETRQYSLKLPTPLYRVDANPERRDGDYPAALSICADAGDVLTRLADRLGGRLTIDPALAKDVATARLEAEADLRAAIKPYDRLVDALAAAAPSDFVWARDITISNATWGNRLPALSDPRNAVHPLGGGIGQGLAMGIGAALAAPGRKTAALIGDGAFMLNVGELATAVEAKADMAIILMNDGGYGVIRNIQDARYEGRHYFADLHTPDFGGLAASIGAAHRTVRAVDEMQGALEEAFATAGPAIVEIDMAAIGPFARPFAGPPMAKKAQAEAAR